MAKRMKEGLSTLEHNAARVMKLAGAGAKLALATGVICLMMYALREGYIPSGLSLGDGFIFLLVAFCFGAVYLLFAISLTGLGMCFSPVVWLLFWIVERLSKLTGKKHQQRYPLAKFHWSTIFLAPIAGLFIFALGRKDTHLYWHLPLVAILLYMFYSIAQAAHTERRSAEKVTTSSLDIGRTLHTASQNALTRHKTVQATALLILFISPLLLSQASGQLLDAAMRLAKIRLENRQIYVKTPYTYLLPASLRNDTTKTPEGFKAYDDIAVTFHGFGDETRISFKAKNSDKTYQTTIPNNHILISPGWEKSSTDSSALAPKE